MKDNVCTHIDISNNKEEKRFAALGYTQTLIIACLIFYAVDNMITELSAE